MKKLLLVFGCLGLFSCAGGDKLIESNETRAKVAARLEDRTWLPQRALEATAEESEGLDFMYAYMGMGDAVDFGEELYLTNVKSSLLAKSEMPWSSVVPNDLFLHFVLPVRVNNENLDTSRVEFYAELKDRVKGLSMEDAILEVNHWCHEKAVYTPSDSRTSSPGATVKSAYGRCGEESTFTVAALRAVGIPARQIYTPRWAHTDDNHAWVEAWANGKWHYIGACEPEPILNCGWFDAPSKRAMLMFTKVFGDYTSNEEVIERTDGYTEINVTNNYTPVKQNTVKVVDENGNAVEGANVMYTIYNYAEFYPSVRKISDANGQSQFSTGVGDMMIIASKNGTYGRAKIAMADSVVTVVLDKIDGEVYSEAIDIVPPVQLAVDNGITPEMRKANDVRWAREDSIRGAYVATFINEEQSAQFAKKHSLADGKVWSLLSKSRGNYANLMTFIDRATDKNAALDLLEVISDKDLKDVEVEVLEDHLNGAAKYKENAFYKEYILCPRIDDEMLVGYKAVFDAGLSADAIQAKVNAIALREDLNPAKLKITVVGVEKLGMADQKALHRYAISLFRSNGFAARREPITEKPQYYNGSQWVYIAFPQIQTVQSVVEKGSLNVELVKNKFLDDPKFYTHFTLGKLKDGEFVMLNLRAAVVSDMGEGASYKTIFSKPMELEVGTYQLMTGTRMADGSVAVQSEVFVVEAGKQTNVKMMMRENTAKLQVIANFDPEVLYVPNGESEPKAVLSTTGRGYLVLAVIDAKKEPTTHFLRGLESISAELNKWERPIVLVLEDKGKMANFNINEFPDLPKTVSYGYDYDQKVIDMLYKMVKLDKSTQLPIVVVGDSFGRVVYKSTGYNTSVGQQLKDVILQLN